MDYVNDRVYFATHVSDSSLLEISISFLFFIIMKLRFDIFLKY